MPQRFVRDRAILEKDQSTGRTFRISGRYQILVEVDEDTDEAENVDLDGKTVYLQGESPRTKRWINTPQFWQAAGWGEIDANADSRYRLIVRDVNDNAEDGLIAWMSPVPQWVTNRSDFGVVEDEEPGS